MRFLSFLLLVFITQSVHSQEYGDWEKKYPEYKKIFELNKQLFEDSEKIRSQYKNLVNKNNKTKKDREKIDYLFEISMSFFNTSSITNVYGQSLLITFSSNLSIDKKSLHFNELCINLNYLLPSKTSSYKDSNSYKLPYIELGKEVGLDKSEQQLLSSGMDKQFELTRWMENTCKVSLNKEFWTVK